MTDQSVTHGTFTIERHYPVVPERVFDAFADPAKKRRWFAEGPGFIVDDFALDFKEGGFERSHFRFVGDGPLEEGTPIVNETRFQHIVPNRRIVLVYTMTIGGQCISSSQVTVQLVAARQGTDVIFTEQGAFLENADGPEIRQQGWQELLGQLEKELSH